MKTRFHFPTRILFGQEALQDLVEELTLLEVKRPLVVTDEGLSQTDLPGRVLEVLKRGGLEAALFAQVTPNPTALQVEEGAKAFEEHGADGLISLGGGSPTDTGRAIQIRIDHHDPLEDYDDLKGGDAKITGPLPPMVAIPTTAGTGSEVSRSAVITIDAVGRKVVLFSPRLMPAVALCDPELTYDLPPRITAETGMDALSHNLEAYLSKGYHPMADAIALKGIQMIMNNLLRAFEDGHDELARQEMMMASTMGAVAFQKGLGVCHSLAHAISSVTNMGHGLANSILLPHVMRFNALAIGPRLHDLTQALGARDNSPEASAQAIEELSRRLKLPQTLSEAGVQEEHLPALISKSLEDGCHTCNPRPCTASEMEELFCAAL